MLRCTLEHASQLEIHTVVSFRVASYRIPWWYALSKTLSLLCFLLLSSSTIWKVVVPIHVTFRHLLVGSVRTACILALFFRNV
jgi:hypothetical protein